MRQLALAADQEEGREGDGQRTELTGPVWISTQPVASPAGALGQVPLLDSGSSCIRLTIIVREQKQDIAPIRVRGRWRLDISLLLGRSRLSRIGYKF